MLRKNWLFGVLSALLFGSLAHAQVAYTITNIIDTTSQFANFGHFLSADDGAPVLNSAGTVGFWAQLDSGPQGFFTLNGATVTTIADNTSTFTDFSPRRPAMNSNGRVAFFAQTATGPGVFAGSGGGNPGVTTIANTSTPFPAQPNPFGSFGANPSINAGGVVAFTGASGPAAGVFTGTGGGPTTVALSGAATTSGNVFGVGNYASINDGGTVAFRGTTGAGTDFHRIWSNSSVPLATVFSPLGTSFANGFGQGTPSINASGNVAFHAFLDSGETGIFRGNGGTPTTIVDSSGPFSGFGLDPSINALDQVAFIGLLDAGGYGIYDGPNPVTNRIISIGDALFGSTVNALNIGGFGLNDLGQLAFFYNLADGRNGLALATPVPEPTSIALLVSALGGIVALRRRTARQKRPGATTDPSVSPLAPSA